MSEDQEIEVQETDTLADALNAAFDHIDSGGKAPDVVDVDAVVSDTEPVDVEAIEADVDEASETTLESSEPVEVDQDEPETPVDNATDDHTAQAPSSWKKDISEKWSELPPEVRAEIHRRESDYHKGIEQYKQAAEQAEYLQQAIAPYMQNIQASGVPPAQALQHLLGVEHTLRNGTAEQKTKLIAEIARDYGVNLEDITPAPPLDPQVQQLIQQNRHLQQFQQTVQQQQQSAVKSEIERFRDNPENVHFEEVREDMAVLLETGRAANLQDAYDMAVWMRPEIRQTLVQTQRAEAEKRAAEQQRKQRAKTAAGSVKGSANSKATSVSSNASLRDTLTAALDGDI